MTRARLSTFARRQALTVTATNGNRVIRYLAVPRRWRATGLVIGLLASIGWAQREGAVRFDALTLFAGWFAGALVAELRPARLGFDPEGRPADRRSEPWRAASLVPRNPTSYLPRSAWLLLPGAVAISLVVGGASLIAVLNGRTIDAGAAPWCAAAIVVASAVLIVQRRVLHRPQGLDAADVPAGGGAP